MNFGTTGVAAPKAASSEYRQIFPNRMVASSGACHSLPGTQALPVGIGLDQAGIDREAIAADQPFGHAALDHRLEHLTQQIAIAEAAMPVLREGRMVRNRRRRARAGRTSGKRGSGEPPRTTAVPNECRSNSQRSTSGSSVPDQPKAGPSSCKMAPIGSALRQIRQNGRLISASLPPEHVAQVKTRRICALINLPRTHHRLPPSRRDARLYRVRRAVFQHNPPKPAVPLLWVERVKPSTSTLIQTRMRVSVRLLRP